MRIACLLIPDLPLYAERRANPELAAVPLVITTAPGTRAEILCACPRARALGVHPGLSLTQARALTQDLVVRVASPALEESARQTLFDVAISLAPRAELAPRASGLFATESAVFVDAEGTEALHGNERAFASVLHARAERAGFSGVVAITSSRSIARLAARHAAYHLVHASVDFDSDSNSDSPDARAPSEVFLRILAPGQERAFLSPLPIDLLDPSDRTAEALTRFGIHRIHDLLRLPRRDLAARLGPEVLELVAKANGEEIETPLPEPKTQLLEEGLDLEAPIANLEALAFVLRGLVSRLLERLDLRALGCAQLDLELKLENTGRETRRIGLAQPTQDERVLLRLLRLALESNPPRDALEGLVLRCEGIALRREQLDFFRPRGPSPSQLDQTLAELTALCGADRVGAPVVPDSHRPDVFGMKPFRPRDRPRDATQPPPASQALRRGARMERPPGATSRRPRITLRAFRPPLRAEVRLRLGKPCFLRSSIGQGEVVTAAGPFRRTGEWWSESTHFAVDHYDIQMRDGTILRLCFDWKTKWWRIDGLYD